MTEVGTFEAKNKLSELLDRVERGEEVVITRRGKRIAKIVKMSDDLTDRQKRSLEAMERIRARAESGRLGRFNWEEWKAYRDEGRK
jgi:prevent-host-death family protein